jgi:hypothetical protein
MRVLCAVVVLAGCVAAVEPAPSISFGNGGSITGPGITTTVTADDRVTRRYGGYGAPAAPPDVTIPGAYARAADVLADQGVAAQTALPAMPEYCPDYGADSVTAVPPVAGFSAVKAGCPDDRMLALIAALQDAVAE